LAEGTEYAVAAGIIQFDPIEREAAGQDIRDITIKAIGSQKLIKVTLWPEFEGTDVKKGDFVVADGKFTTSLGQAKDGSQREYLNLSASQLVVVPAAEKAAREVVGGAKAASGSGPLF
jgi:hypothetical protein